MKKIFTFPRFLRYLLVTVCCVLCIALLGACDNLSGTGNASPTATVQPTTPTPTSVTFPDWVPPEREYPSLTYSAKAGGLLVFGGEPSGGGSLDDTWLWNGQTWLQQHPTVSPPPVYGEMVYDAATGQTLLFGGYEGERYLGDTWLWDGTNWTEQHPANSPSPRQGDSMVYDAAMGQIVLFGGEDGATPPSGKSTHTLNDTWAWNGSNWIKHYPVASPPARYDANIAYDAATRTVVLFGGNDGSGPPALLNDTWIWDGTNWTEQHPATAPQIDFQDNGTPVAAYGSTTSMAYDAATQQVVMTLQGGENSGRILVSWLWNGNNWAREPIQTTSISTMSLFYSTDQNALFAFASDLEGGAVSDSLWKWTGQAWQQIA